MYLQSPPLTMAHRPSWGPHLLPCLILSPSLLLTAAPSQMCTGHPVPCRCVGGSGCGSIRMGSVIPTVCPELQCVGSLQERHLFSVVLGPWRSLSSSPGGRPYAIRAQVAWRFWVLDSSPGRALTCSPLVAGRWEAGMGLRSAGHSQSLKLAGQQATPCSDPRGPHFLRSGCGCHLFLEGPGQSPPPAVRGAP